MPDHEPVIAIPLTFIWRERSQRPTNNAIADLLERIGQLLETKETNPYRVRAYFSAAATVRGADESVAKLAGDRAALMQLPGIGDGLAGLITEFVQTGQSALLRELESEDKPGSLFDRIPGVGETLSRRIAETLDIRTLEELEQAAHDGQGAAGKIRFPALHFAR